MQSLLGKWVCIIFGFLICVDPGLTSTIYVDINQTLNPEDGKTWATAWNTIAEGVNDLAVTNAVVKGGHTILVNTGSYPLQTISFTTSHSGLSGSSNVFMANGTVNVLGNSIINTVSNSYFTIDGFSLGRIAGDAGTNIVIRNCILRPWANQAGVNFAGDSAARHAVNVTISRCVIMNVASGNFGVLFGYLDSGVVENCTIVGMDSYGTRA